ncbi:hypothetical protein Y032_0005g2314 [Ancylostoma ceylanicum]|uniref:Uncharacterized protein n=1 Tax=Ancylostoma ceylanicum TaxID=53326 RepID=A0A016VRC3_9BILA|nr:hypothetical protein Y032_0005g2314 [Ancylostoma ceylanicum]
MGHRHRSPSYRPFSDKILPFSFFPRKIFSEEDTKYGVCEGRKISRILGLNTTSSELRMLVVYSDAKKVHKKDAELVPSRILRHYAPQVY